MSAGPLVVEIICTCCLAAFLLHRYGDLRKQNILTTLTTFISWYFSFLIIFVLPLDVSSVSKLFNLLVIFIHKSIWFFFLINLQWTIVWLLATFFWLLQTFYRQCLQDKAPKILTTTTTTLKPVNVTNTSDTSTILSSTVPSTPALQHLNNLPVPLCQVPLSHVPENVLPTLWQVVYWTSQLLTWYVYILKWFIEMWNLYAALLL